jgi:ferredoxin/predicted CopG family antitoxin
MAERSEETDEQGKEEDLTIKLNPRAHRRLSKAKKGEETFSDVVIRLTATKLAGLQRRGKKEILTLDNKKLMVSIDQSLCFGAESCVALSPSVFDLDVSGLGREPLGMLDVVERSVDSETIVTAARSCPYKAIKVVDANTDEELSP